MLCFQGPRRLRWCFCIDVSTFLSCLLLLNVAKSNLYKLYVLKNCRNFVLCQNLKKLPRGFQSSLLISWCQNQLVVMIGFLSIEISRLVCEWFRIERCDRVVNVSRVKSESDARMLYLFWTLWISSVCIKRFRFESYYHHLWWVKHWFLFSLCLFYKERERECVWLDGHTSILF